MVSLTEVERTNAARAAAGTRPFVAVVAGGTAGIGMYGVLEMARTHGAAGAAGAGLRVYIVGRRPSDALVAECRQRCPGGVFTFIQAKDLGLLADVDRVAAEITQHEEATGDGHVDLLVASQGVIMLGSREKTAEGLDCLSALVYYGRARLADRLLPLLEASGSGRAVFVLNPLLEGPVVADDLTLRKRAYGLRAQAAQGSAMTTWLCEALAARHPGVAFVHWYPGAVPTDLLANSPVPRWLRVVGVLAMPLMRLLGTAPAACGQRVQFFGTGGGYSGRGAEGAAEAYEGADGQPGSGAYRAAANNDSLPHNAALDADRAAGMADTVYAHTMAVFGAVEATGVWEE